MAAKTPSRTEKPITRNAATALSAVGSALDDEIPDELLPEGGVVAVDRTRVRSVYITSLPESAEPPGHLDAPVHLGTGAPTLYHTPADGVVITTEQVWTPKRLALGRLLHSLPLAPGESTRVAIVDWTRQDASTRAEETSQAERLTDESARDRGVTEITEALAREEQSGSSTVKTRSGSGSIGGALGGLLGGLGFGGGVNSGTTTTVSRSSGTRGLSAKTAQRISERTQQLATSIRDRRASVITETAQAEAATASTRVVTNYNHMHAMTVQYWEVVQEYAVATSTKKVERCLFVPMALIDFDAAVFRRYAALLAAAAPPGRWAERLSAIDPFEVSIYRTRPSWSGEPAWVPAAGDAVRLAHFQVVEPGGPIIGVTDANQLVTFDEASATWVPHGDVKVGDDTYTVALKGLPVSIVVPHTLWRARGSKVVGSTPYAIGAPGTVGGRTYACQDGHLVRRRVVETVTLDDGPVANPDKLIVWSDMNGIVRVELRMRGGGDDVATTVYAVGAEPPPESDLAREELRLRRRGPPRLDRPRQPGERLGPRPPADPADDDDPAGAGVRYLPRSARRGVARRAGRLAVWPLRDVVRRRRGSDPAGHPRLPDQGPGGAPGHPRPPQRPCAPLQPGDLGERRRAHPGGGLRGDDLRRRRQAARAAGRPDTDRDDRQLPRLPLALRG